MNLQRFIELTQAYGAAQGSWPPAEQDAALALLLLDSEVGEAARTAQADAGLIDDALASYRVAAPDQGLIERITASFPAQPASENRTRRASRIRAGKWRPSRLWFSGVGLLGAGAIGVASGVLMMSLLLSTSSMSQSASDSALAGSVFSNSVSDWSDQ